MPRPALDTAELLCARLAASAVRVEAGAVAAGLRLVIGFVCDGAMVCAIDVRNGALAVVAGEASDVNRPAGLSGATGVDRGEPDIVIAAVERAWQSALADVPAPGYSSFAAWQLKNPAFEVRGEPLTIAQARALLEVLVEGLRTGIDTASAGSKSAGPVDLSGIVGRYRYVRTASGSTADIYFECVGDGPPLLCLHTAGADSRQFHALMADTQVTSQWRVHAFDMPSHGRSLPPHDWDGARQALTQEDYLAWCTAVIEQIVGEPVTLLGGSMGAAMALVLAADRPALVRGVVALEPPVRPRGRRNAFLTHAAVHGGLHSAAYVRGLMGPQAPLRQRRMAAWIYSQGAPGVYDGDLAFYSDEFDGEEVARRIDGARMPVQLLVGHYDFSATVADAHALAGWIQGAEVVEMPELGHFPMIENPAAMQPYLLRALAAVRRGLEASRAATLDGATDASARAEAGGAGGAGTNGVPLAMERKQRMPPIADADLTEAQKAAVAALVAGPRGTLRGVFVALLHSPELMDRVQRLGEFMRSGTVLPNRVRELVVLSMARFWTQQNEWASHRPLAVAAGLSEETVQAIEQGCRPPALRQDEAAAWALCDELQRERDVSDGTYQCAVECFGERGLVELLCMTGYIGMVSAVMNGVRTPLPPDVRLARLGPVARPKDL